MEHICRIGMDTSKHIFQLHGVSAAEHTVLRKKLRRKDMVAFFERLLLRRRLRSRPAALLIIGRDCCSHLAMR